MNIPQFQIWLILCQIWFQISPNFRFNLIQFPFGKTFQTLTLSTPIAVLQWYKWYTPYTGFYLPPWWSPMNFQPFNPSKRILDSSRKHLQWCLPWKPPCLEKCMPWKKKRPEMSMFSALGRGYFGILHPSSGFQLVNVSISRGCLR